MNALSLSSSFANLSVWFLLQTAQSIPWSGATVNGSFSRNYKNYTTISQNNFQTLSQFFRLGLQDFWRHTASVLWHCPCLRLTQLSHFTASLKTSSLMWRTTQTNQRKWSSTSPGCFCKFIFSHCIPKIAFALHVLRYFYHHRHYARMLRLFESWDGLKLHFTQKDRTLWRDANLIGGIILASTVIENGLGHLRYKHNPGYSHFWNQELLFFWFKLWNYCLCCSDVSGPDLLVRLRSKKWDIFKDLLSLECPILGAAGTFQ